MLGVSSIAFTLFILFVSLFADDNADIGFKYGFLSKSSNDSDNITILSDSSIIHTGDLLKINIGYKNKTNFYIVYKDAVGSYVNLYSKEDEKKSNQDTLYVPVLYWSEMLQPPGIETFYFINSNNSLSELAQIMKRYEKAPPKGKSKLAIKIQEKIDALDPDMYDDITSIASRLDKPVVGGVSFRGDDENLKDLSVKKIEKDFKIVLNVSTEFLNKQKTKNYLLELEEILKKNVDFRLEVFIKMMLDVSKLRVGKSFKDYKV